MTARAVILGLLVAVPLASVGYVNDVWMQFSCIGSDLMPTHAYGLLLVGLLLANPVLRLVGWQFSSGEFVVMLALVLMGSVIAGSGLLWTFPHPLITPIQDQANNPGWESKDLLGYVPEPMLVRRVHESYARQHGLERTEKDKNWRSAVARAAPPDQLKRLEAEDARLVKGYMTGLGRRGSWLAPGQVPWEDWAWPLAFWFSVLGLTFVAGLAAVVIVHRQWSQREHLSYPLVILANELVTAPDDGGAFNPIFRNGRFWIGFGFAFAVLLVNGYYAWNPRFVQIPLGVSLAPFGQLLGPVAKVPWVNILQLKFFFAAVGLGYFLTSEASFSLGISNWMFALAMAPLLAQGVDLQTDVLAGGLPAYMYFGAYVGMGVMVVYLGRRFYWALLKRTLFAGRAGDDVLPREALAGRILLLAGLALVLVLWHVGLHPLLGAAFVLLTGLGFLMVGRLNVSTGLFIIQPFWQPVGVLLGMLGTFVLGPKALIILALLSVVVTIDPRIAVVPLALNVLKLGDLQRVKPGRLAGWMGAGVVLAMVVAVPVTVYLLYNLGLSGTDSSDLRWALDVARMPLGMLERAVNELAAADALEAAQQALGLERLGHIRPARYFWMASLTGLGLVLACSYLRLRWPRWPLHPVVFLVWGTPWPSAFAASFLLAWIIKEAVMRYGGQKAYYRARPIFIGMMSGEFAAGLLWGLVGVAYWAMKGVTGPRFLVRP